MVKRYLIFFIVPIIFLGCAPSTSPFSNLVPSHKKEAKNKKKIIPKLKVYTKEDFVKEYKNLTKHTKNRDLIWDYEAGTLAYLLGRYPQSIHHFDEAEKLIKTYDEEVLAGKLFENIGSLLSNDTFLAYRPKIYEKIMVNTLKGIDFTLQNDKPNARIEFNRALVRQKRAALFFAKEIQQEREKLKKDAKQKVKKNISLVEKAMRNKKTMEPIEKKYTNLFAFKPYRDFVNPFTTYLAGIYFLNVHDYRKATDLLKECYGMIKGLDSGASYVLQDFKMADNLKRYIRNRQKKYTWVIFFNGQGPIKAENKIQIPLFIFSDSAVYSGIALPTLKMRFKAYDHLLVSNGKVTLPTKRVASMDTIIKTEFKKRFKTIVTRAMMRTITQTIIQKQLRDKAGFLGGLVGAVYQASMNKADIRMWKNLPKEFQVARLPSGKTVTIKTDKHKRVLTLHTNPKRSAIIFISIPTPKSEPLYHITYF